MRSAGNRENKVDMLHGPLFGKILLFSLPITAGSILQQMFNAVDMAVVGRFASSEALAAVGANTPVVMLFLNLFIGISVGSNVLIARYIGQGDRERISDVVHTSVVVGIVSGLFLLILSFMLARPLLQLMSTPDNVLDLAVLYLKIYALGMPFIMVYNFGAAILRSIGDTRRPLYCLVLSGFLNAFLNVIFVAGFHQGVAGVAVATVISNILGALMVVIFLLREESEIRLLPSMLAIHRNELLGMLWIGIPAGLQGMVFSFSNVCIQTAINSFGSDAVAASAAAVNFEFICYFAINGFNQAAVTFISQNYGAGNMERCRKVYRICILSALVSCLLLNGTINLFGEQFVRLFTTSPRVISYALIRVRYVLLFQWIASSYEVTGSALRGYGYSMIPAVLTVFGTCVLRILWILTVHAKLHSFPALMAVYPFTWVVTGIMMIVAYRIITARLETDKGAPASA